MTSFLVIDDSAVGISAKECADMIAKFPRPVREQTMPDGTTYTEFPGGSILIQTPLREDGWLSKALGECK